MQVRIKLPPVKVLEKIYWVGAIDWNIRHFHGFTYSTHRGTTYNAYLIVDKKIALVDTVPVSYTHLTLPTTPYV